METHCYTIWFWRTFGFWDSFAIFHESDWRICGWWPEICWFVCVRGPQLCQQNPVISNIKLTTIGVQDLCTWICWGKRRCWQQCRSVLAGMSTTQPTFVKIVPSWKVFSPDLPGCWWLSPTLSIPSMQSAEKYIQLSLVILLNILSPHKKSTDQMGIGQWKVKSIRNSLTILTSYLSEKARKPWNNANLKLRNYYFVYPVQCYLMYKTYLKWLTKTRFCEPEENSKNIKWWSKLTGDKHYTFLLLA